jgi:NTP pyrophosphatase (non-canonical NTP hydrolase)
LRIRDLQIDAYAHAIQKVFWDATMGVAQSGSKDMADAFWALKLALIHGEVSEALEALRKDDHLNFAEELADVVIRVADLAGGSGVDLEGEITRKMAKNKARRSSTARRFNHQKVITNEFPISKPKGLACNTLDTEPQE